MSRFEYLSVLVSIVIALGIAEVTISWGRIVQIRTRVSFSWLHGFWSVFLLLLMIQFWWGFWNFRNVEVWSFGALLAVVVLVITLVFCALLLVPRLSGSERLDLLELFLSNVRPFFLLGAFLIVQLAVVDVVVAGTPLVHPENAIRLVAVFVTLAAAASTNVRFHTAIAVCAAALLSGFLMTAAEL